MIYPTMFWARCRHIWAPRLPAPFCLRPPTQSSFNRRSQPETALWRRAHTRSRSRLTAKRMEFSSEVASPRWRPSITLRGFMPGAGARAAHHFHADGRNRRLPPGATWTGPDSLARQHRPPAAATGQPLTLSVRLRLVRWVHPRRMATRSCVWTCGAVSRRGVIALARHAQLEHEATAYRGRAPGITPAP